jgi:hypothetical protein
MIWVVFALLFILETYCFHCYRTSIRDKDDEIEYLKQMLEAYQEDERRKRH